MRISILDSKKTSVVDKVVPVCVVTHKSSKLFFFRYCCHCLFSVSNTFLSFSFKAPRPLEFKLLTQAVLSIPSSCSAGKHHILLIPVFN